MKSLGPALSRRANHSLASSTGSSKTPVLTRRTCTFSPRNRNSLGNLTAWLRPLRNSFATTRSAIATSLRREPPGSQMIYTQSISPCSNSCSNLAELGGPDAHLTRLQVLETSSKASKKVSVDESVQVSG